MEIEIRDVGPRDGLQSESPVAPARRTALAVALADAGVRHVEAASFVSPKAVPSMAGGDEVVAGLPARDNVTWWALVPNARGAELALAAGVRHVTVTISASDGYSRKNVGRPTDEAVASLAEIGTTVADRQSSTSSCRARSVRRSTTSRGRCPSPTSPPARWKHCRPPASRWPTRPAPPRRRRIRRRARTRSSRARDLISACTCTTPAARRWPTHSPRSSSASHGSTLPPAGSAARRSRRVRRQPRHRRPRARTRRPRPHDRHRSRRDPHHRSQLARARGPCDAAPGQRRRPLPHFE